MIFDLDIISGCQIPKKKNGDKDIVDPYVTVEHISSDLPSETR
jgi:hypothetical protein